MGKIIKPSLVLPAGAFMVAPAITAETVSGRLGDYFDGTVVLSNKYSVQEFTHYYDKQSGNQIDKYFFYVKTLVSPEGGYQWKIWSNAQEKNFPMDANLSRPANIDPGYLSLSKLVLFSTKEYSHRIYIKDGIYAEVTLHYRDSCYRPHPWTYQDFQTPTAIAFWERARQDLKKLA